MRGFKKICISAAAIALCGIASAQQSAREVKITSAEKSITNPNGEVKYKISLNPFYVNDFEEKAGAAGYIQADILKSELNDPAIERPAVRMVSDMVAASIKKKPLKVRSWVATEFEVEALPDEIAKLAHSEAVIGISEVEGKPSNFVYSQSTTIAPGDVYSGSEIIPWWKIYTNTNDSNTYESSGTLFFVIDGPIVNPISTDLVLGLNYSYESSAWSGDPNYWPFWHAAHVDGVIAARNNNQFIRGVNLGQPLIHLGGPLTSSSILDRLNYVMAYSELTHDWAAINMSFNNGAPENEYWNQFEFSKDIGRAMAVASNRHIILQSAGNNNDGSCGWGYGFYGNAPEWDGIMLIGGHDSSGQRSTNDSVYFNNGYGLGNVPGSNYGPCVELWAPSKQITSLRYNSSTTQVLSGTSFSAPIAAAIAMRHGNSLTRPLQREWFLKKNSQYTGSSAGGTPIYSARWNSSPNSLTRHTISSAWSPQTTTNISNLYNGNYSDIWNSGGNIGTIVIDLGAYRYVKFLRLTPRSSVGLGDTYPIYFSIAPSSDYAGSSVGTYQNFSVSKHGDRAPITIPLNDIFTRYIVVNGHNYGSWLAYSEVEVYGQ